MYLPTLGGSFLNYDDDYLVVANRAVQDDPLGAIFDPTSSREDLGSEYLPLRDVSYAFDSLLWAERDAAGRTRLGDRAAFGFRLSNLAWYGLACALCALFLFEL